MQDDKAEKIELALAHQEQKIEDLSDMLIRQSEEIERLKTHILRLEDKLGSLESAGEGGAGGGDEANRKPPHY